MATSQSQRQQLSPAGAGLVDEVVKNGRVLVQTALVVMDKAQPIIDSGVVGCQKLYRSLAPYHPEDFLPFIVGFLLILFGGTLPITIAAVEAFRLCGWRRTKNSITLLWQQYRVALSASKKDDTIDENNDGIPDVLQIDTRTLLSRKVALFMRCTDPKALDEGISGLTAGLSAVIATLRLQFAQTLALGVSLGDIFNKAADHALRPALVKFVPPEYQKWISMGITYLCRSLAVTVAWWCQRVISALHSATRGAQLMLYGFTVLARRFNIPVPTTLLTADNPLYPIICGALGAVGLYYQLARGFSLPFPFNILLLPFRVVEWLLYYFLAYSTK